MSSGTLFVIAAPSGAGKTSLVSALLALMPQTKVSISYTTRSKRPAEQEGINYYFVTEEEFKKMAAANMFLEHAKVHGHYYGTSRQWVEKQLAAKVDVILEIDWQGAAQIKKQYPQSVSIFILPPGRDILAERLRTRGQDDPKVIQQRLAAASEEIAHYAEFDYLVVNDVFDRALEDLKTVVCAQRLRGSRQADKYALLLSDLLQKR